VKAVTAKQMRRIDQRASEECGVPSSALMENAGRAVFRVLRDTLGGAAKKRVAVFCGKGNNGGDGLVAARLAAQSGACVSVVLAARNQELRGDAALNLERALECGLHVIPVPDLEAPDDLPANLVRLLDDSHAVVDALLGTGISGPASPPISSLIACIARLRSERNIPVISVDVPSGIDSDTGQVPGEAVRADDTVAMGLPKLGLLLYPAAAHTGRLHVADIGFPAHLIEEAEAAAEWVERDQIAALFSERNQDAHKGDFGRVFIIAGSPGMTGAATLCGAAALRAGAGLVTVGIPASLNAIMEEKLTEVMSYPLPETSEHTLATSALEPILAKAAQCDVVAFGPGISLHPETAELTIQILQRLNQPLVVDADALTNLAPQRDVLRSGPSRVITPHPGEMGHLLRMTADGVQADRLGAASGAAHLFRCVAVLKGAHTVVAAPGETPRINPTGNAGMASGGTGDVLTGLVAGLMAQGLAAFDAATAAAYLHGLAGDLAAQEKTQTALIAWDLIEHLPQALRTIGAP
jgi:NAD(P)H-hydrate epimerase